MSLQIKNSTLLIVLLGVFIGVLALGWTLGTSHERKSAKATQDSLQKEITRLVVELNDKEYYATKVEQELATEKELRKKDIIEKKELKALNIKQANEITKLRMKVDTLLHDVIHNGQVIDVLNSQIANYDNANQDTVARKSHQKAIILPFMFEKTDKWLSLKGNFDDNGKLGISLFMDMSVKAISGIDKQKKPTLVLSTDNPYIQTISVESYKTDTPRKKTWGIGLQAGYGLNKNFELSPYLGIGVSRNLVVF